MLCASPTLSADGRVLTAVAGERLYAYVRQGEIHQRVGPHRHQGRYGQSCTMSEDVSGTHPDARSRRRCTGGLPNRTSDQRDRVH